MIEGLWQKVGGGRLVLRIRGTWEVDHKIGISIQLTLIIGGRLAPKLVRDGRMTPKRSGIWEVETFATSSRDSIYAACIYIITIS